MTYQVRTTEGNVEQLAHPAGEYKASFDLSRFFGRDSIREIIDRLNLHESETLINGHRRMLFHNENVAISFTKDPWQDYPRDKHGNKKKVPVYREEWGGQTNPLRPARSGYIHIIGSKSEVVRAYNLIDWRSKNKDKGLGKWIV